jgi:hypothetical protein
MDAPLCFYCQHKSKGGAHCAAFGNKRIPTEITTGTFVHDHKHPVQPNDILFEPASIYVITDRQDRLAEKK